MIRASDMPVRAWTILVVLLLLVLSAGCRPPVAPPVYALPVAAPPALPSPPEVAPTGDACDGGAVVPGEPMPGADAHGIATCRGQLVRDDDVIGWLAAEDDARACRELAAVAYEARLSDRALCEAEAARRWEGWQQAHRDAVALRWAGYGLGLSGLVVGLAVGLTAGMVAP